MTTYITVLVTRIWKSQNLRNFNWCHSWFFHRLFIFCLSLDSTKHFVYPKKLSEDCTIRTMSPWSHHSFIRCKTKKGLSLTLFNMGGLCKVHYMVETATKGRYDHLFISWPLLPAFRRMDVRLAVCLPIPATNFKVMLKKPL